MKNVLLLLLATGALLSSMQLLAQSDRELDCHKNDPTPQAIWDIIHAQQHNAFCTNYTFSNDGVTVIPVAGLCEHRGPGGIWYGKLNCNGTMDSHGEFVSGSCDLMGTARCVAYSGTVRNVPYTLSCGSGSAMPMALVDVDRASCVTLGGGSWVDRLGRRDFWIASPVSRSAVRDLATYRRPPGWRDSF